MSMTRRVIPAVLLLSWMFTLVADAQPPVREVEPQQPAKAQQPAGDQAQAQQGEAPKLRDVQARDAAAQQPKMQRSVPTQTQQSGGPGQPRQTGPLRMKQQPAQMIVGPQWFLGVWDEPAPNGVRVSSVSWNSPASSLGLESGDYIMDVMGYPVGWYQGWYYPLGQQLNQHAQPDGWINLMIWNKRTGQQKPFWVRLVQR